MVARSAQKSVPAASRLGASEPSPAAWEAWGHGSLDAKGDRVAGESEDPLGRRCAALPQGAVSTRTHILDTAERHFAEYGFAGVTMRSIAIHSGLKNQASLYHHFRDKRALYEAALARGVEPIVALLVESTHGAPPAGAAAAARRRAIEAILDRLFDYLTEHPHLPRLIQRAIDDDSRHLHDVIPRLLAPIYDVGVSALAGTGARWEMDDLPHLAFGIYHLIFGYFANATMLEEFLPGDPRGAEGVDRQRRFVKAAVTQLLGVASRV